MVDKFCKSRIFTRPITSWYFTRYFVDLYVYVAEVLEFPTQQDNKSNVKLAIKYYEEAAKGNSLSSICALATHYYYGTYVNIDKQRAIDLFKTSANQGRIKTLQYLIFLKGHPLSILILHMLYPQYNIGNKDIAKLQLEEMANMNDRLSNHWLGVFALNAEHNEEKAILWWKKASELGVGMSMYCIAERLYINDKNFVKAFEMYVQSSTYGYAMAYYKMGIMYLNGEGIDKDMDKGVECFTTGASYGDDQCLKWLQENTNSNLNIKLGKLK